MPNGFQSITAIRQECQILASSNPEICEYIEGPPSSAMARGGIPVPGTAETLSGGPLFYLRLTNRRMPGPKPVLMIVAGEHPRELGTTYHSMSFARLLIDGWAGRANPHGWLLDEREIIIVPCLNVDGYELIDIGDGVGENWMVRKAIGSAELDSCSFPPLTATGDQPGTDLARNGAEGWGMTSGDLAGSDKPCEWTHRGSAPENLNESKWIRALIEQWFPSMPTPRPTAGEDMTPGLLLSLHGPLDMITYPLGWDAGPSALTDGYQALADSLATAPPVAGDRWATTGQTFDTMYQIGGSLIDTADSLGVPGIMVEDKTFFQSGSLPTVADAQAQYEDRMRPLLLRAAALALGPMWMSREPAPYDVNQSLEGGPVHVWSSSEIGIAYLEDRCHSLQSDPAVEVSPGDWRADFPPGPIEGAGYYSGSGPHFVRASIDAGPALGFELVSPDQFAETPEIELPEEPPPALPLPLHSWLPGGLHFDGAEIWPVAAQNLPLPMVITAWINPDVGKTDTGTIFGARDTDAPAGQQVDHQFYLYGGNRVVFRWGENSNTETALSNTIRISSGWQFVAASVDDSGAGVAGVRFFRQPLNGTMSEETISTSSIALGTNGIPAAIGGRWPANWFFHGEIAGVRVYDVGLSLAQLEQVAAESWP